MLKARKSQGKCEVPIYGGHTAIVDEQDYEYLSQFSWHLNGYGYAVRTTPRDENGNQKQILMHREILNAPEGVEVDHRNRKRLDNRRKNLRLATISQQRANTTSKPNRTCFRGVKQTPNGRFRADVMKNKKMMSAGTFDTPEEAARAYDRRARELFGEFAILNFPEGYTYVES